MSRKIREKNKRTAKRTAGMIKEVQKKEKTKVVPKWLIILVCILTLCSLALCFIIFYSHTLLQSPIRDWEMYHIEPEYMRSMKKILLTIPVENANIHAPSLDVHLGLIQYFPDYTETVILLPKNRLQTIEAAFRNTAMNKKVTFVGFDTRHVRNGHLYLLFSDSDKIVDSGAIDDLIVPNGTAWAQDLFEVSTKTNGQKLLMVSDVYKYFISCGSEGATKAVNDNAYLDNLSSAGLQAHKLPFTFMGGNILVDEFGGKKFVVCGGDVFRHTQMVSRGTKGSATTDIQINNMIKTLLNADEVVCVGRQKPQPLLLFHLDQAMIFLHDGVAGITNVVGERHHENEEEVRDVEQFLSELRRVLKRLGYKLVNIDTSVHDVLNRQYFVNSIPYVDASTGQKTILMPVSPETQNAFEDELVKKNTASFESLGYKVIPVPSEATKFNGGIHCLVNVIE